MKSFFGRFFGIITLRWPEPPQRRPWWVWVILPPCWLLYGAICLLLVPAYIVFLYGPLFAYWVVYVLYKWTDAQCEAALWRRPFNPWLLWAWALARWTPAIGVNLFVRYLGLVRKLPKGDKEG